MSRLRGWTNAEVLDLIEQLKRNARISEAAGDEWMKLRTPTVAVIVDLLKRIRLPVTGRPSLSGRDKIREQVFLAKGRKRKRELMAGEDDLTEDAAGNKAAAELQRDCPPLFARQSKGTIKDKLSRRKRRSR